MSQVAEDTRATESTHSTQHSFSPEPETNPSSTIASDDEGSDHSHSQEIRSDPSHPHDKRYRKHRKANHRNELVHQPQQYPGQDELMERETGDHQVANKSEEKSSAPRLKLDLDLEAELDLKVKVKGDVTLSIL